MGGGDLNLKKSWHPLLMKNQERVWQEEKKAIDERKRTQQLLKEQAEERQIQELQRLGGKREERVDWLYNAPAAGSGQNTEEMEAYLLGKKSVEQLFQDQDRKRLEVLKQSAAPTSGSASTSTTFQAIGGNANSVRDLAAKIRDDPLLAIKRQEQKAYEELMKNPKRLQELRAAREGREGKPSKKHKHKDGEHKHRSKHRHDDQDKDTSRRRRDDDYEERSRRRRSNSLDERDERKRRRSVSPPPRRRDRSPRDRDEGRRDRRRSRSPPSRSYNDRRRPIQAPTSAQIPDAAARLAAMTASAAQIHKDRDARLAESDAAERAAEEREAAERQAKMVKGGGRLDPTFLKEQQEKFMKAKLEARG